MNKRPLAVTIIAWVYVAAGVVGLAYHATEFKIERPFENDASWVCSVRLLAIVWMAWHVGLSIFHPLSELIVHALLLVVIAFFLFGPRASAYFRAARTSAPSGD